MKTGIGSQAGGVRAIVALVVWGAIAAIAFVLGVQRLTGQAIEEKVLSAATFTTAPPAPLSLVSPLAVVIALAAVLVIAWASHGFVRALFATGAGAVAIVASQLMKDQFERPQLLQLDELNTFPSGHMTVFAAVVCALIWAVPQKIRAATAVAGAALMALAAYQLLAYGWHRPSDLIGAFGLTLATFSLAALVSPRSAAQAAGPGPAGRVLKRLLIIACALLLVASLVALGIAVASGDEYPRLYLVSAQLGLAAVSAAGATTAWQLIDVR